MLFNTPQYILFLPIVVIIYYCLPEKVRYIWLLIVSYYFYMQWNPLYIILLFSCTFLTYACGRIIEYLKAGEEPLEKCRNKQKLCFIACIVMNLGILFFFQIF